jgi:hypothetical protein
MILMMSKPEPTARPKVLADVEFYHIVNLPVFIWMGIALDEFNQSLIFFIVRMLITNKI